VLGPDDRSAPVASSTGNRSQAFSHLVVALDRRSAPRLILLFLGAVLARGWRTVTSRAAADGIAEGREAQPLGDHAAAGDRPNFGAENAGHGLTSGRPALGSHASSRVAFIAPTRSVEIPSEEKRGPLP
jgi:hypothetical protein